MGSRSRPYKSIAKDSKKKESFWNKELQIPLPEIWVYSIGSFAFLALYVIVLSQVPSFLGDIYKPPLTTEQPLSDIVDRKCPFPPFCIGAIAVGAIGVYMIVNGIDFLTAMFIGLWFIIDTSSIAMINVSVGSALQTSLVVFAMVAAVNTVGAATPLTKKWFLNLILSWTCAFGSIMFNIDSVGVIFGLYVIYLMASIAWAIESIEKSHAGKGDFSVFTLFGNLMFYSAITMLSSLLFFFGSNAILDKVGRCIIRTEAIDFSKMLHTAVDTPGSTSILIAIVSAFVIPSMVSTNSMGLIYFVYHVIAAILTVVLPFQCTGDTIERKIFFAKLQLLLAGGMRLGTCKNLWVARAVSFAIVVAVFIARIQAVKASLKEPSIGSIRI